jgi:hypothetical protein
MVSDKVKGALAISAGLGLLWLSAQASTTSQDEGFDYFGATSPNFTDVTKKTNEPATATPLVDYSSLFDAPTYSETPFPTETTPTPSKKSSSGGGFNVTDYASWVSRYNKASATNPTSINAPLSAANLNAVSIANVAGITPKKQYGEPSTNYYNFLTGKFDGPKKTTSSGSGSSSSNRSSAPTKSSSSTSSKKSTTKNNATSSRISTRW